MGEARRIYLHAAETLTNSGLPFMIGGGFAMPTHGNVIRDTKDLDVFCTAAEAPLILNALASAGYRTLLPEPLWLGKALRDDVQIDVIYNTRNGLFPLDESWFETAVPGELFGIPVMLLAAEEMIVSKLFVRERDRFDGADINHIILKSGGDLDWHRLNSRLDRYWEIFLSCLLEYRFVFPQERDYVPEWLMRELVGRLVGQIPSPDAEGAPSRGHLLAPSQYHAGDRPDGGLF